MTVRDVTKPVNWIPNTKVLAGGGAGTLLAAFLYMLTDYGIEPGPGTSAFLSVLVGFITAYFVPEKEKGEV